MSRHGFRAMTPPDRPQGKKRVMTRQIVKLFLIGYSIAGLSRRFRMPYYKIENRLRAWSKAHRDKS